MATIRTIFKYPYLVFAYDDYAEYGGMGDFVRSVETKEAAYAFAAAITDGSCPNRLDRRDQADVVSLISGVVCEFRDGVLSGTKVVVDNV